VSAEKSLHTGEFRVPVLMYHYLGTPGDESDEPYYVSGGRFDKQMHLLWSRGYQSVGMKDLVAACRNGKRLPAKPFVITFDDGHQSFHGTGVPVLEKYGFSATMFLITSRIGNKGYLDWPEIIELSERNIDFESHGVMHSILTRIDSSEAETEIIRSKEILEDRLGREVCGYAYRGGHFNENIKSMIRSAGYHYAVCSRQGLNDPAADLFEVKRRSVKESDNASRFWKKISPNGSGLGLHGLLAYYLKRVQNAT